MTGFWTLPAASEGMAARAEPTSIALVRRVANFIANECRAANSRQGRRVGGSRGEWRGVEGSGEERGEDEEERKAGTESRGCIYSNALPWEEGKRGCRVLRNTRKRPAVEI